MKYFVRVGTREHQIVIDGDTRTVDGHAIHVEVAPIDGAAGHDWLATVDGRVYRVVAWRGAEPGSYALDMGGVRLDAEATDERRRALQQLSGSGSSATGPKPLLAPMPGMIVRVHVTAGDHVRAGQGLVVMEAMKMENELRAAADGTVKSVRVTAGTAVEKGALLIEMA